MRPGAVKEWSAATEHAGSIEEQQVQSCTHLNHRVSTFPGRHWLQQQLVFLSHLVFDGAGNSVGKILDVFVIHFLGECDQSRHLLSHFVNFFVGTATTLAVAAFIGALACTGIEFHERCPLE